MTAIPGRFGQTYHAIPGPSVMPERVLRAMHRGAPDIYAGEMQALVDGLRRDLCALAGTAAATGGQVALYIGNGHASWEAAAANLWSQGDRVLAASSGHFGRAWAGHLAGMGIAPQVIEGPVAQII